MRITIVGGGKVGFSLAQHLTLEKHEITLIDPDEAVVEKISNTLDVICYVGNGASFSVLREVGIESCDLLIAVTASDELNMLACLSAHKLGAGNTIARVRNPEYAEQLYDLKRTWDCPWPSTPKRRRPRTLPVFYGSPPPPAWSCLPVAALSWFPAVCPRAISFMESD